LPIGGITDSSRLDFKPSWEVDFLGGLNVDRQAVRADYAATRFNVEAARASLVANVADSYFQARGLAIQIEDATEQVNIETGLLGTATLKLGYARGVALLAPALVGIPVIEYGAKSVKLAVVGTGGADKAQVQMMVRRLLPGAAIRRADAADALAVAICHAHHRASRLAWATRARSA